MTEREMRDLARQLADGSEVFDLDTALEFVRFNPAEAEKLMQMREEMTKRQKERDEARERRRLALREDFG